MKTKNLFLFLLVLAVTASHLFATGSRAGSSGTSGGPTLIRISTPPGAARTYRADQPQIQEVLRRLNIEIEYNSPPNYDALNLVFASNDLPDLIAFQGMDFQQYISTGYLRPLDDLLRTRGQNVLRGTSQDAWRLMTIQGNIMAMPYENTRIKRFVMMRSDWLRNVGVDLSRNQNYGNFGGKVITLDQYRDILIRFTRNDPDGNGRGDTYGVGSSERQWNWAWGNVYGAFGGIPGHYYITNNVATPWVVTDQYRAGLQYLNSLWREGVIDPEIYLNANDQAMQKMINGVSGSASGEWWSRGASMQIDGMRARVPEAELIPIRLTSNDGRISGAPDNGLVSHAWTISTTSRVADKAMDLLDFLSTDEGWYLAYWGIQGVDYNMVNGFPVLTDTGNTKRSNDTLDPLYILSNRRDLANHVARRPLSADWTQALSQQWSPMQDDILPGDTQPQPSYTSAFYGIPNPQAFNEYGVDVETWIEQSAMAFITGETPLNDANWNNYLNTWRRMGGVRILQGFIDSYNRLNGTRITAGITE